MPKIKLSNIRSRCCEKKEKTVIVNIRAGHNEMVCQACVKHMIECNTCELSQADISE